MARDVLQEILAEHRPQTEARLAKYPPDVEKYQKLGYKGGILEMFPPPGSVQLKCDNCPALIVFTPEMIRMTDDPLFAGRPPLCLPCIGAVFEVGRQEGILFTMVGVASPDFRV